MPGPESETEKNDAAVCATGAEMNRAVGRRKTDGVGKQIIKHLHDAMLIGDEAAEAGIDLDIELDILAHKAVLQTGGRFFDGLSQIDRAEIEFHCAGVDGGEIENIVGDGKQRIG